MVLRTAAMLLGSVLLLAPAMAQDNSVIRIGVINDQSGPYADLGGKGSVIAAQMAIDDFGGKVRGKPVEMISADHQNKPDIAANIVRQWFDNQNVGLVVDLTTTAVALAVRELAESRDKILIPSAGASSDLTGKYCSPNLIHWTFDSYALANVTTKALIKQGSDSWFFLTGDNSGSIAQEQDAMKFVKSNGGTVVGSVRHPLNTSDFSSFLLQAQASKAKVIGLANAGSDTVNSIKQAGEFGITHAGQKLASLLMFISDVHAMGLQTAQGLLISTPFYWDANDETRAWSRRFMAKFGRAPTMAQAGVYGAVQHYLKTLATTDETSGRAIVKKMKATPVNDFMGHNVQIREDGRVMRDIYLVQVKTPQESKEPWDYYKILATVPANEAFRPLSEGGCSFVSGKTN
ncbi:MAG: ABC transporter substrate-binding protein [Bradyrhizobium sp.]|uniref:ABC transporter substrate-binding protein n=2 Tax=Bradyrhizobium japonicum TaxID=375 RepID=UPI000403FE55|nr:ABC transporter substrate-binding protein [Bradyrhizobium japonicum]MBJ7404830.1 ABC transporter substrate-binding protein [Bradyrhizobium sp.]